MTRSLPSQTTATDSRLLRVRDVADRLAMSPAGVRRAVDRGEIKAVRIGHRVGIPETEIDRLIASAS